MINIKNFSKKLIASFCGAMSGIIFAMVLSIFCSKAFHIHGAVMHNSEALLYSGFQDLNLTQIFMASVCIGASGSVMDLSVDITSEDGNVESYIIIVKKLSNWKLIVSVKSISLSSI